MLRHLRSPRRRSGRRSGRRGAGGLLIAVASAVALLCTASPVSAGVLPGEDALPVEVQVEELAPRAPADPAGPVQLTGRLTNRGSEPVADLQLQLLVGGVLQSRGALARAAEEPVPGRPRTKPEAPPVDELAPGESTTFDLRTTVADLRLTLLGVYPVALQVRGRTGDGRRTDELGLASTFVPWFPDGPPLPTRLAWLWPLVDEPRRAPGNALLDTALDTSLAEGGRLAGLLAAARSGAPGSCDPPASAEPRAVSPAEPGGPESAPQSDVPPCRGEPVPITYAADPELLGTVAAMTGEHSLLTPDGEVVARPPSASAGAWLAELKEALAGAPPRAGTAAVPAADLIALPYADPDVVALSRAGGGLPSDVEQLRVLGERVAEDVLDGTVAADPLESVAWPPAGPLSAAALDAVVAGGARAVVLDEAALPPRSLASPRTPGARTGLSSASAGPVTGLVVEDTLSRLLAASPDDPDWQGARLAEQRWLAETAMISAELPGVSRTLLVAPPRRGAVLPEVAGAALLDSGRLPWLCAVPLADVVGGSERCATEPAAPPEDSDPDGSDTGEADPDDPDPDDRGDLEPVRPDEGLPAQYLDDVAEVQAQADQLTDDVLVPGTDGAAALRERVLQARARALSSAWRTSPRSGRVLLDLLADDVAALRSSVQVTTSGTALLTSSSGVIDVSVSNGLDQPVTVAVELNDPVEARLTSTDTDLRTVGPRQVVPVRVQVQTRTSGRFVVRATLLDRAGRPFGDPVELVARSNNYGRAALAVTGVGAGVLLVAAGVQIVRRATGGRSPGRPDPAA